MAIRHLNADVLCIAVTTGNYGCGFAPWQGSSLRAKRGNPSLECGCFVYCCNDGQSWLRFCAMARLRHCERSAAIHYLNADVLCIVVTLKGDL
ncbi:MAG: hypothetical protein FWD01_00670, partial [Defluviitaleaceae bacterium]|nr:hypothetical protein [Defluviitaleaceae bacterium]